MKIVEYEILGGRNIFSLVKAINIEIRNGWQPMGGPFLGEFEIEMYPYRYYQAIIKYEEEQK